MSSAEPSRLRVSVVYLRPALTFMRTLVLQAPATVGEAIEASDVRRQVPELAGAELAVGVFGQPRTAADVLHDGDRVEIYRPLTIDPKEARRVRVAVRRRRQAAARAKPV
jgi:hypothetical protein